MTKTRSLAFVGATALFVGCTAGVSPTPSTGSAGTGQGPGSGGTSAAGTSGGGSGGLGFDASVDIGTADHSNDGVCSTTMTAAEPVPLDLYVTVDLSKSMNLATASGPTKWDAVKSALNTFFANSQSMGIGAGLGYFPIVQLNIPASCTADGPCAAYGPCDRRRTCVANNSMTTVVVPLCIDNTGCTAANTTCSLIQDCGGSNYCAAAGSVTCPTTTCMAYAGYCHARDVCDSTAYATPVVPIAPLSGTATGQAATLATSLGQHSPDGYTPTGPALKGAIQYAQQYSQAHAGHKVAIVLVTDGLPLAFTDYFNTQTGTVTLGFPRPECTPNDIPGIAAVAAGAATPPAGTPAVPTFVVGVYSSVEGTSIPGMLNSIATGGGTAPAVLIDTSTQDVAQVLQAKLAEIRTKAISCEFQLPAGGVDFKKVNVQFTSGTNQVTPILHSPPDGAGGCDARGGWYYDKDPATGTPTKITACPASCSTFQTDLAGHVDVILGCPTIDVT